MLCESCKEREATVHLTQVVEGAIKKLHLCEECAKKSGMDIHAPISITDILLGMGIEKPAEKSQEKQVPERTCPRCHMRRTDFTKTGRFGCAHCYGAFSDGLPELLKAMHRSTHHAGKVPKREGARVIVSEELATLEKQMAASIAAENYEEAARLRDRISDCRKRLNEAEARGES